MVGIQHRFASDPYSLVKESHVAKRTRHADHVGTILGQYKYKSAYGEKDRGRGHGVRCRRNCERHYILVNFQSTSEPTISLHLLHRIYASETVFMNFTYNANVFLRDHGVRKRILLPHTTFSLYAYYGIIIISCSLTVSLSSISLSLGGLMELACVANDIADPMQISIERRERSETDRELINININQCSICDWTVIKIN